MADTTTTEKSAPESAETAVPQTPAKSEPPLKVTGGGSLLATGNFSDFVVVCGEKEWKVHKLVICGQSEYFHKACTGQYNEAKNGRIDLSCDDEAALNVLLEYLYTQEYTASGVLDANVVPDALLHLRVHVLADKYGIKHIGTTAAEQFTKIAQEHYHRADFSDWVVEVLETTPLHSILRKLMFGLVKHHLKLLTDESKDDKAAVQAFKAALLRCPDFAFELLGSVAKGGIDTEDAADMPLYSVSTANRTGREFTEGRARCHVHACQQRFAWPNDLRGSVARCPKCGQNVLRPSHIAEP